MTGADAIVKILQTEGIKQAFCYPTTPLLEAMARAGLRVITSRQERVAGNMADGFHALPMDAKSAFSQSRPLPDRKTPFRVSLTRTPTPLQCSFFQAFQVLDISAPVPPSTASATTPIRQSQPRRLFPRSRSGRRCGRLLRRCGLAGRSR